MDIKYLLEVLVAVITIIGGMIGGYKIMNKMITKDLMIELNKHIDQMINEKLHSYSLDIISLTLTVKRMELSSMIVQHPDNMLYIVELYDEYKRLGGNSYIDIQYNNYIKNRTNEKSI
jgi:hypothetical protein